MEVSSHKQRLFCESMPALSAPSSSPIAFQSATQVEPGEITAQCLIGLGFGFGFGLGLGLGLGLR